MQIVLSGNRVIAHGENCFLAMGGTVICEETGKAYQNATIAEVETLPADIGRVGYEYHAGIFVPCAPYGKTEGGYMMAACYECATPRATEITLEAVRDRLNTFATIAVQYPPGSVCTCEKGSTIIHAKDTSGVNAFNVPEAGRWTIKITNGKDTVLRAVEITKRWQYEQIEIAYFAAYITVTFPGNSRCTCTDGVTTYSTSNVGVAPVAFTFIVPNAGKWTITAEATDGSGNVKTDEVEINTDGQRISRVLSYQFVLIAPGTAQLAEGYTQSGGSLVQNSTYGNYYYTGVNGGMKISPVIDVTNFKKLKIKCCSMDSASSGSFSANFGLYSSEPSLSNHTPAVGLSITDTATAWQIENAKEFEVKLDNITGEFYFAMQGFAWGCAVFSAIFE